MDIKKILESLVPFIVIGLAIAVCVALLFMFFSIAIWGVLIGGILWIGAIVKQYLFPSTPAPKKEEGRIIEHDDRK